MKKHVYLLLLPCLAMLYSCQKIEGTVITGTSNGTSATYQPLTANSTWKYRTDYSAIAGYVDTSVITMSAKTLTINGKQYNQAYQKDNNFGYIDTGYYYAVNHEYSTMQTVSVSATSTYSVEFLYLKDNLPVGGTWATSLSYPSIGSVTLNGKITEKGISKTVAGKVFTNVIHTTVALQMTVLGTPTSFTYEIYVAQGVGIVRVELIEPGAPVITEDLIGYSIK